MKAAQKAAFSNYISCILCKARISISDFATTERWPIDFRKSIITYFICIDAFMDGLLIFTAEKKEKL